MTAPEVLVLWVYMGAALFFAWQMGSLIGYWRSYGWPWIRAIRRWLAQRHRKEAEAALFRWAEQHHDEVHRLTNDIACVALLGMTSEEAIEAFAALARELRARVAT